ncbi:serine/threonine protein phosphatase [Streptomyces sp. NPDC050856]|uniref:serine/threonine protein phosphatase n=1 Tax=Streptomyces sp. NPDC050856 TaxID=3154939 RepID=UPI0033F18965
MTEPDRTTHHSGAPLPSWSTAPPPTAPRAPAGAPPGQDAPHAPQAPPHAPHGPRQPQPDPAAAPERDAGAGPAHRVPPPQRIWRYGGEGLQALSVWTERVPGRGEDADPLVAHHWDSGQGLLAVFDGSGGSGAAPVWQAPDGESRTGAWVGARVARLATDCWFREVATGGEPEGPESLREYLQYFLASAPQRRSKIGGTMRRQLPTTLAAVHYRMSEDHSLELHALWAGDSRAYLLRPETGLQVLTRDHTRESDALELLRTDPPMTNLVCADRDFLIGTQRLTLPAQPCVLVTATDGFFGYVHTPADFEYVLLHTLHLAHNEGEWADLLRREVQGYTADDASLALLALSHGGFGALRGNFAARYAQVTDRYVRTRPRGLDRPAPDTGVLRSGPGDAASLPARVRAWQDETWHAYRAGYETYLPPATEEHA